MWTQIVKFLSEPLVIPVYSSLVAVALTFTAQWVWEKQKYRKARKQTLSMLSKILEMQKVSLGELEKSLGDDKGPVVHPKIDTYAVNAFLENDYVDVVKDSDLIWKLHLHLYYTGSLNSRIGKIDLMPAVDFTDGQTAKAVMEASMEVLIPAMLQSIDECLNEIDKRLT